MESNPYMTIIYTRYAGPTNTRGSRIVASAPFGPRKKVEVNYDHALGAGNHLVAAQKFLQHGNAQYDLIGHGDAPDGAGYAYVFKRRAED